jgi:hypothetical protein
MSKKALCVGINRFKNFPEASLQGCVNDAWDMASVLKEFYGFAKSEIVLLKDAQATKSGILTQLKLMAEGAKKGEYESLVFSMSSHGTQVPDTHGDEPDRFDEAFCPHDLASKEGQWDPRFIILDDELGELLCEIPEIVLVEVFLDTCHSGTGLKAVDLLLDRKPRFLPPPSLGAFKAMEGRTPRGFQFKFRSSAQPHQVLWAACRSDQTSADAAIDGAWHGAFTYYFCKEVRACENKISRAELLKRVRMDLAANHYPQVPQLECEGTLKKLLLEETACLVER